MKSQGPVSVDLCGPHNMVKAPGRSTETPPPKIREESTDWRGPLGSVTSDVLGLWESPSDQSVPSAPEAEDCGSHLVRTPPEPSG